MHSGFVYRQKVIEILPLEYMNAKDIDVLTGKNLKRLRQRAGLTQDQLGEKIGVDGNVIAQIEGAVRGMGKSMKARICTALKVHPWEFDIDKNTPIITDPIELEQLEIFRQARALGTQVAEEITSYGMYKIAEAEAGSSGPSRSAGDRLRRGLAALRKMDKDKK